MKKVVITAGHGGSDSGAVNGQISEAFIASDMRNMLAFYLTRDHGIVPTTDGLGQVNLPLTEAIRLAKGADLAIEIHTNAFTKPTAGGVETISTPKRKAQAQRLSKAISRAMDIPLRGEGGWIDQSKSARGRLGFINQADGLIIEMFFISNPTELTTYMNKKWLVAKALAEEIALIVK
jgi:N-acetylmuramoyl-L-alanine amidase